MAAPFPHLPWQREASRSPQTASCLPHGARSGVARASAPGSPAHASPPRPCPGKGPPAASHAPFSTPGLRRGSLGTSGTGASTPHPPGVASASGSESWARPRTHPAARLLGQQPGAGIRARRPPRSYLRLKGRREPGAAGRASAEVRSECARSGAAAEPGRAGRRAAGPRSPARGSLGAGAVHTARPAALALPLAPGWAVLAEAGRSAALANTLAPPRAPRQPRGWSAPAPRGARRPWASHSPAVAGVRSSPPFLPSRVGGGPPASPLPTLSRVV